MAVAGDDTLVGCTGDDTLNGEADDDIINGAGGSDDLYGGTGNDTFVFSPADGAGDSDSIHDWDVGSNKIDLSAFELTEGAGYRRHRTARHRNRRLRRPQPDRVRRKQSHHR